MRPHASLDGAASRRPEPRASVSPPRPRGRPVRRGVRRRRDLLGIRDLAAAEILGILDTAENFSEISTREVKKVPALRGKTVINLFFEASTRTRTSFELAAKRLSADAVNISVSSSSVSKGETLLDTAMNLDAMAPDCIVVRHSSAGVPHQLAKVSKAAIVNAGDGANDTGFPQPGY